MYCTVCTYNIWEREEDEKKMELDVKLPFRPFECRVLSALAEWSFSATTPIICEHHINIIVHSNSIVTVFQYNSKSKAIPTR